MSLTSREMQNTYAVAHDTSKQSGGSVLQAHLVGLHAVASRASHDGYALATQPSTSTSDVSDADLLDIWIEAKKQGKGTQYATDLSAIHAVRQALASNGEER